MPHSPITTATRHGPRPQYLLISLTIIALVRLLLYGRIRPGCCGVRNGSGAVDMRLRLCLFNGAPVAFFCIYLFVLLLCLEKISNGLCLVTKMASVKDSLVWYSHYIRRMFFQIITLCSEITSSKLAARITSTFTVFVVYTNK